MPVLSRNAFPKHERRRNASTSQSTLPLGYSCGRVGTDRVSESNHGFKDQSESSQVSEQGRRAYRHGHGQLRGARGRRLRTRRWHGPDLGDDYPRRAIEGRSCRGIGPGFYGSTIWRQELRHRNERRASPHQIAVTEVLIWSALAERRGDSALDDVVLNESSADCYSALNLKRCRRALCYRLVSVPPAVAGG